MYVPNNWNSKYKKQKTTEKGTRQIHNSIRDVNTLLSLTYKTRRKLR